ncbi:PROTEIN BIG GRAIN 1-LIKE A-RELATED [Salix viminalis]|uniref:PROTEIN BIG GRAIN 1-LIKE A-RELATED n=1 Tax=Salix viminalis TaxID=40686 RepID=A0A9Q0NI94_SALVM|nr:PROTEIN BIG GRAIN 1-LIKE A-RELATED [Salix viminalis]
MSITGLSSDPSKPYKKSLHRRNNSDELDVFEAARYFSGYNEAGSAGYNGAAYTQKFTREDHKHSWRGGRMSLDVPMRNPLPHHLHQQPHAVEKQILKEKKYKQPSSPGGRLASFLNSLFSQTSSKKKKSKSTTQSMKDDDESPGGRRKRRSSISHFRSSSTTDTKSLYYTSSSGFRTPSPYAHPPTKGCKDFRNLKVAKDCGNQYLEKGRTWADDLYLLEENEFRNFNEVDDGAESDSSSDLFELQNCDLGIYSNGLPVYETTHMDSIKRGAVPISNGTL